MSMEFKVSVVIPTLAGASLEKTILSLNSGTIIPTEILVVIPNDLHKSSLNFPFQNIIIINSISKGQVNQRTEGFKKASNDLVLQIDDDIVLAKDALELLIKKLIKLGPGNVIGPSFFDPFTKKTLHKFNKGLLGLLKSINASVFSAAPWGLSRMGKITKIGLSYGVDFEYINESIYEVEWLPGGCVLSHKQDLILDGFYPFPGKAFSEDVIHSILRSSNNINHYVKSSAFVETVVEEDKFLWKDFKSEFKARHYIVQMINGSIFRLYIWAITQILIRKTSWKK
jgi:glycosyltransferase involved in cell wall biosynthesis